MQNMLAHGEGRARPVNLIIIIASMAVALWLSRVLERKWLPRDLDARQQLRRRFHVWCFRAAAIAFVFAVVLAIYLRSAAVHG